MNKELFIKSIEAIEKQALHDEAVAKKLGEVYAPAFDANLLYDNHHLSNALMEILQVQMDDIVVCKYGQSWIEYFCFELDFGRKNDKLKATNADGTDIPLNNAAELWDFLENQKKKK